MTQEHRTIHPSSLPGTHPSYASPGLRAFQCSECGTEVRYTQRIDSTYEFNGEPTGLHDIGENVAVCWACAEKAGLLAED